MPTTSAQPSLDKIRQLHFIDGDEERIRALCPLTTTHYEVFGLEPRLVVDVAAVREVFLDLSRKFHPDFFATAAADLREESLRRSSLLNNAWKTMRDDQRRAEYLIGLHGRDIKSNKNAVPAELLEEMFEIQEAGEELREARLSGDEAALESAEAKVKPLREEVKTSRDRMAGQLQTQFDELDTALDGGADPASESIQQILQKIRTTLDQLNYLRTVMRNLK